jgi:hypothetical protein
VNTRFITALQCFESPLQQPARTMKIGMHQCASCGGLPRPLEGAQPINGTLSGSLEVLWFGYLFWTRGKARQAFREAAEEAGILIGEVNGVPTPGILKRNDKSPSLLCAAGFRRAKISHHSGVCHSGPRNDMHC